MPQGASSTCEVGDQRLVDAYDRATEFAGPGGKLIELPDAEWKGLAARRPA